MTEVANIVCMKWGTKYGADYVNRLHSMVKRNITKPFRMVCYTDNKEGITPEVEVYDLPPFKAAELQKRGAYRKKMLCKKDLVPFTEGENILFLDLDVVIMNNIDALFEYKPEEPFIICYNWTRGNGTIGNSSVTRIKVGPLDYIATDLEKDFLKYDAQYKTASQEYMSAKVIEKYGKLTFWPEEWCKSFQVHVLPGKFTRLFKTPKQPSPETKIMIFHGMVNPPDAIKGEWPGKYAFWKKWYKTVRPTPWLAHYWH
jgi:hypothetical protein